MSKDLTFLIDKEQDSWATIMTTKEFEDIVEENSVREESPYPNCTNYYDKSGSFFAYKLKLTGINIMQVRSLSNLEQKEIIKEALKQMKDEK